MTTNAGRQGVGKEREKEHVEVRAEAMHTKIYISSSNLCAGSLQSIVQVIRGRRHMLPWRKQCCIQRKDLQGDKYVCSALGCTLWVGTPIQKYSWLSLKQGYPAITLSLRGICLVGNGFDPSQLLLESSKKYKIKLLSLNSTPSLYPRVPSLIHVSKSALKTFPSMSMYHFGGKGI